MEFKFPKLTIFTDESVTRWVLACPKSGYIITDDSTKGHRYVILYELSYGTTDEESNSETLYTAIIPYYVSDGRTNNLRASMLYPFMCFNEYEYVKNSNKIISSGCSQSNVNLPKLLFKYGGITNLDFTNIKTEIESQIFNDDIMLDNFNKINKDKNGKITIGVLSVLPRITNLLDFLIAICSDKINNDVKNLNDDTIKYYRPNREDDPFNYYTYADQVNGEENKFKPHYDKYRKYLLKFFADMKENLDKLNILNDYNYEKIIFKQIRMKDFNNLPDVKVCNGNEINTTRDTNYNNYQNISKNLFSMIKIIITTKENYHKLALLDKVSYDSKEDCDESKSILKFINKFNSILINNIDPAIYINSKNDNIDSILKGWRSTCKPIQTNTYNQYDNKRQRIGGSMYNKYLKYKAKYLALKKLNSH